MGWNLLSYKKKVAASSSLEGYGPELANDEQVETWWAAQTGNKGEWLQIDLGEPMDVKAIQVNFAAPQRFHQPAGFYPDYRLLALAGG